MKKIPVWKNRKLIGYALVDNEDFDYLNQWDWYTERKGYVRRVKYIDGKFTSILLHREVMKAPKGMLVDHRKGNRWDNRKSKLRICTNTENVRNSKKKKDNTSGYKGVSWHPASGFWRARVHADGKEYTSYHRIKKAAARAYNKKAKELFGEFARLNIFSKK